MTTSERYLEVRGLTHESNVASSGVEARAQAGD